ncbi:methyl-accepting chemotaxis protein [Hydrogenispora ethanolica]|uniref:Methyl-accepting chemotaxis protein n=1 Tax=Hydrogenispora ethanolica TaxID=1082276 RepID=A0A4R1RU67_HYDET|nr:methyl-accepting chemotaxis protein [Hydrogenispora ethanolica]TCL70103.1 methyl-accepting chemotaxis protein [Hydrogenispora ethanolica]
MRAVQGVQKIFAPIVRFYLDLKIIWKMVIGFGLVLAAVFVIATVSQLNIDKMQRMVDQVIDGELEPMAYIHDIRSYIAELEVSTRDALLKEDAVALRYVHNQFLPHTVLQTVNYSFERLIGQATSDPQREQLKQLQASWQQYYELYLKLTADLPARQNAELNDTITKVRFFLVGGIDRMVETDYRQRAVLAKAAAKETFEKQQFATLAIVLSTVLLAIAISLLTTLCTVAPLNRLAAGARKIAEGDLTVTVQDRRGDELGELAGCFNLMTAELRELIEAIKRAADKVNENSKQLIDGTYGASEVTQQLVEALTQVAEGADQQQQRVASIHGIVQVVSDFSDRMNRIVHNVAELSENTVARALHGEEVADAVVDRMRRIEQFMAVSDEMMQQLQVLSQEIAKMAASVRDIAEQTNLLSLNAAIEAARAGEHGRGFGVVAEAIGQLAMQTKTASTEVGKLVHRIQAAFTELSGMIETENRVIQEGEQDVASLGEVFDAISDAARQVNQELGQVTQHTAKLAVEHGEVLKAVEQITTIATEHKAGTESASTAAFEHYSYTQAMISAGEVLGHWGDNLRQAVSKFKYS